MHLRLALTLPHESVGVPVVRRVLGDALRAVGVADECVEEIQVAVTEACANVLRHAGDGDVYEVAAVIDDELCHLEVIDRGPGISPRAVGPRGLEAAGGRGFQLMRALVDAIDFEDATTGGTVVRLRKRLRWHTDVRLARLRLPAREERVKTGGAS